MSRLILKNANLLDGDAAARRATVVVAGERIEAVATGLQPDSRPDDRVVDLNGRTVMPGMVLGHYHSSYYRLGSVDKNGATVRLPVGMDAPPGLQILRAAMNLQATLSGGFTSVVSAGTP